MYLKQRENGHLIEVLSVRDLVDPTSTHVVGRMHYGEEAQDPEKFHKDALIFPSGEPLPQCWVDPNYRDQELQR